VIALFYSSELAVTGFAILVFGILLTLGLHLLGIRSPFTYFSPGGVIWVGAYSAGIHPTLAGVILGLMTPVKAWYGPQDFLDQTEAGVQTLRSTGLPGERALLPHLDTLRFANRESVSPLERLQHSLHGWVAFGIMPLFAFANAGVPLGQVSLSGDTRWVFWGVLLGLAVGKPIGIVTLSWFATRLRVAALPSGVRWPHVSVVGMVGGIGFTMALFIAQLAFPEGSFLETAKLAVLCGSIAAGVLSLLTGYRLLSPINRHAAKSEAEAAASTTD
jgi:NhaA family Na+:H+ antiporter